jgi:hypothetical protein
MTTDENITQNSDGGAGENLAAAAGPAERGPDGKFLPGNHAAGEHLFKPGVSGNPAGRPSMRKFTTQLREALDKNDGAMIKALINVICQRALRGDYRFVKEILERVEGKVSDRLEIESQERVQEMTESERVESRRLTWILLMYPNLGKLSTRPTLEELEQAKRKYPEDKGAPPLSPQIG